MQHDTPNTSCRPSTPLSWHVPHASLSDWVRLSFLHHFPAGLSGSLFSLVILPVDIWPDCVYASSTCAIQMKCCTAAAAVTRHLRDKRFESEKRSLWTLQMSCLAATKRDLSAVAVIKPPGAVQDKKESKARAVNWAFYPQPWFAASCRAC